MVSHYPTAIETVLSHPVIVPGTGRLSHRSHPPRDGGGRTEPDTPPDPEHGSAVLVSVPDQDATANQSPDFADG